MSFIIDIVLFIICFLIKRLSSNQKLRTLCSYVLGYVFGSIGGAALYGLCATLFDFSSSVYPIYICTLIGIVAGLIIAYMIERKNKNINHDDAKEAEDEDLLLQAAKAEDEFKKGITKEEE